MIPGLFIVHPPFLRPVHQFFPAIATQPIVRRRACSSCSLAALAPGQSQMGSVRSGGKRKRNHPCSSESGYLHKTSEREAKAGAFFSHFLSCAKFCSHVVWRRGMGVPPRRRDAPGVGPRAALDSRTVSACGCCHARGFASPFFRCCLLCWGFKQAWDDDA